MRIDSGDLGIGVGDDTAITLAAFYVVHRSGSADHWHAYPFSCWLSQLFDA
jgi:hypothetical protein